MTLTRPDFNRISEADLQELKNGQIEEGVFLDYKSELYGPSTEGKKEFLKDATSLANTGGGHIVIGIVEEDGIPTAIEGIEGLGIAAMMAAAGACLATTYQRVEGPDDKGGYT